MVRVVDDGLCLCVSVWKKDVDDVDDNDEREEKIINREVNGEVREKESRKEGKNQRVRQGISNVEKEISTTALSNWIGRQATAVIGAVVDNGNK